MTYYILVNEDGFYVGNDQISVFLFQSPQEANNYYEDVLKDIHDEEFTIIPVELNPKSYQSSIKGLSNGRTNDTR